ncbi:hypothetical protein D1872_294170 [compost metagenome]
MGLPLRAAAVALFAHKIIQHVPFVQEYILHVASHLQLSFAQYPHSVTDLLHDGHLVRNDDDRNAELLIDFSQ